MQIELKEFEKYHTDPKGGLTSWLTVWQFILEARMYTDGRPLDAYQTIHEAIENNYTFLLYTCAFLAGALDLKYSVVLLAQDVKKKRIQHNPATGQMTVTICSLIQDTLFEISEFKPGTTVFTPAEMANGILVKAQHTKEHANLARDLLNDTVPEYVKFSETSNPGPAVVKPVEPGDFSWLFLVLLIAALAGVLAMRK